MLGFPTLHVFHLRLASPCLPTNCIDMPTTSTFIHRRRRRRLAQFCVSIFVRFPVANNKRNWRGKVSFFSFFSRRKQSFYWFILFTSPVAPYIRLYWGSSLPSSLSLCRATNWAEHCQLLIIHNFILWHWQQQQHTPFDPSEKSCLAFYSPNSRVVRKIWNQKAVKVIYHKDFKTLAPGRKVDPRVCREEV